MRNTHDKVLYLGGDESNFSGEKRAHPITVYVIAFTKNNSYAQNRDIIPGRSREKSLELIENVKSGRIDFRFGLKHYELGNGDSLPRTVEIAPGFIRIIEEESDEDFDRLELHIDGSLNNGEAQSLREKFRDYKMQVSAHPKRMQENGCVKHPYIVEAADLIAYDIFIGLRSSRESIDRIMNSEKRIIIPHLEGNTKRVTSYAKDLKNNGVIIDLL